MLVVLWQYEVRPAAEAEFEVLYGPDGAWVGLFGEHAGYIDTQLLRGEQPRHYLSSHLSEHRLGRYETPC